MPIEVSEFRFYASARRERSRVEGLETKFRRSSALKNEGRYSDPAETNILDFLRPENFEEFTKMKGLNVLITSVAKLRTESPLETT